MKNIYPYGSNIDPREIRKAFPKSDTKGTAVWLRPWNEIETLTSPAFGLQFSEDTWEFHQHLFRPSSTAALGSPNGRSVEYHTLRQKYPTLEAEGVVRRAKRMSWIYLHTARERPLLTITLRSYLNAFINLLCLLSDQHLFKHLPDDTCPDGPVFFRHLERIEFEQIVPQHKKVRDGCILLDGLPSEIDDRPKFHISTYSSYAQNRVIERNKKNGRRANAVSLGPLDDVNLSKLLSVCDTYRKYPNLIEEVWRWIEKYQSSLKTAKKQDSLTQNDLFGFRDDDFWNSFHADLLISSRQRWIDAGIIIDNEGNLPTPIPSHKDTLYLNVQSLATKNALRTSISTILYANSVYLAFLTAARSSEIAALPFDALSLGNQSESAYDKLIGWDLKTNDQRDGLSRDWPLPRAAVGLVTGAQILHELRARYLAHDIPTSLFRRSSSIPKNFIRIAEEVYQYTGPRDNVLKRMRPSSAQLVAAVSRSPLAVRTVLGHATIEQTLGYCTVAPDAEYVDMVSQSKRQIDRDIGKAMISGVIQVGATDRMTKGVIRMGLDQIVGLNLGNAVTIDRARTLQKRINTIKPEHFSDIYEMIGEDRWQVDEFIGESVSQPRPFQFCTARKGGADFSGACSTKSNHINPRKCKSYCPYNFETRASLELRAAWVEAELSRGHLQDPEITTEDPIFYNSVVKILDWLWNFEGPLAVFRKDQRLSQIQRRVTEDKQLISVLKGESRRTLQQISEANRDVPS